MSFAACGKGIPGSACSDDETEGETDFSLPQSAPEALTAPSSEGAVPNSILPLPEGGGRTLSFALLFLRAQDLQGRQAGRHGEELDGGGQGGQIREGGGDADDAVAGVLPVGEGGAGGGQDQTGLLA